MDSQNKSDDFDIVKWQEENPDVWGDQDENGIDLARLRENLKLTPAERLRKHAAALVLAKKLKEAGEEHRRAIASNKSIS